ncbi:MAG TPA: hypothetical protein VEG34_12805, partial [Thermoanaerobaculia bacterium]|nr:hypothetical protein [Thermoanaerobaculia bacterium]
SPRLLLVAADVNPLVGAGDVAVAGPGTGALTLRCRFSVRAGESELGPSILLGTLPAEALAQAEARWRDIAAGRLVGTFTEQETEDDPEYQDWIDSVVRPAAGQLEQRFGAAVPSPSPALPFPTHSPAEPRPRGAWMRWAAVLVFAALGAGSGGLLWRKGQEIDDLRAAAAAGEAAHRQAIAELEARRADLEARYRAQLREAGRDRERLAADHRAQLEALEAQLAKLRQATEIRNPVLASLDPSAAVRGTTKLVVGPEVSHLLLYLPVDDPAGTPFQVEVSERSSNRPILLQKGLRSDARGEVLLGVPAALTPPGGYRVRLFRKTAGELQLVREHVIEVEEDPRSRPSRR